MNWFRQFIARPWFTIVSMHIHTLFGKPYFKVLIFQTDRVGNVAIDTYHNVHFMYSLDAIYKQAGSDYYDSSIEEQGKIAIYLYDTIGNIAENYMPLEELVVDEDDIAADVPAMGFRGGEEVRQVVDLADNPQANPQANQNPLDVKMG